MGKVILNCPCCMRGVCTCCCSKSISRTMTVAFSIIDSSDGSGSGLTCCLDGVSVELTYTEDVSVTTGEDLWIGSAAADCGTIWVAAKCPPEGRSLIIGVACAETRPGLFSDYQFFTKGISVDTHGQPFSYGWDGATAFAAQYPGSLHAVLDTDDPFILDEPEAPFDEEAFFRWDGPANKTEYIKLLRNDTQKAWWFTNASMIIDSSSINGLGETKFLSSAVLIKNTDRSDVFMQLSYNPTVGGPSGFVLRKNDDSMIMVMRPAANSSAMSIWKITGLQDANGIQIETLAGISHIDSTTGNTWEGHTVTGDGLCSALSTYNTEYAMQYGTVVHSTMTVIAEGERIRAYAGHRKMCEVSTPFNLGETKHGLCSTQNGAINGMAAHSWAIFNRSASFSFSEACASESSQLQFNGNLYTEYNGTWPAQDLSACGCIPATETGSYINIQVTVTATLSNRACEEGCTQPICDDCVYSPCIAPASIDVSGSFSLNSNYVADISIFDSPFTLYKLTKFDNAYYPTMTGFTALGSKEGEPIFGGGIVWSDVFQDDLGVSPTGDGYTGIVLSCVYVSDYFELELDPSSLVITNINNELLPEAIALTTRTKFRWQLNLGGAFTVSQLNARLYLVCELENAPVVYDSWSVVLGTSQCDGPWELTQIPSDPNLTGLYLSRSPGGQHWLVTPATITVQPEIPAGETLAINCPYCCDGEGTVGRNLMIDIEDTIDNTNNLSSIPLTMGTWFGQCNTSLHYGGDALFQWESESLSIDDYPQLASLGEDCTVPGDITSWTIILQCRFHQTNLDPDACPAALGVNCRQTWRLRNCGHFDWVLVFVSNQASCRYAYSNDSAATPGDFLPILGQELESGCNPFYITGSLTGLGPNSVNRNVVLYEV